MLTIRKVMEHVYDRMIRPNIESQESNGGASSSVSYHAQYPPNLEQKIEIYCNNQVCSSFIDYFKIMFQKMEPDIDLRSVKHFIWKQASDLVIQYKVIKSSR